MVIYATICFRALPLDRVEKMFSQPHAANISTKKAPNPIPPLLQRSWIGGIIAMQFFHRGQSGDVRVITCRGCWGIPDYSVWKLPGYPWPSEPDRSRDRWSQWFLCPSCFFTADNSAQIIRWELSTTAGLQRAYLFLGGWLLVFKIHDDTSLLSQVESGFLTQYYTPEFRILHGVLKENP